MKRKRIKWVARRWTFRRGDKLQLYGKNPALLGSRQRAVNYGGEDDVPVPVRVTVEEIVR